MAQPSVQRRCLPASDGAERVRGLQLQRAADGRLHQREVPHHQRHARQSHDDAWVGGDPGRGSFQRERGAEHEQRQRRVEPAAAKGGAAPPVLHCAIEEHHGRKGGERGDGREPIAPPQQQQAQGADVKNGRHREQPVAGRPEHFGPVRVPQPDLRADRRHREPGAVDGFPREHLRQEADQRERDEEHAVAEIAEQRLSGRRSRVRDRDDEPLDRRQQREQHVLPPHGAHHAGQQPQCGPLPRGPSAPCGRPHPREGRHGGHRRRMRHRRLLHEIPEDERAQRDHRERPLPPIRRRCSAARGDSRRTGRRAPRTTRPRRPPADRDMTCRRSRPRARVRRACARSDRPPRRTAPTPGSAPPTRPTARNQWVSARTDAACRRSRAGDSRWRGCRRRRTRAIAGARSSRTRRSAAARRDEAARPCPRRTPATGPRRPRDPPSMSPVARRAHSASAVAATASSSTLDGSIARPSAESHDARAMERPARSTPHTATEGRQHDGRRIASRRGSSLRPFEQDEERPGPHAPEDPDIECHQRRDAAQRVVQRPLGRQPALGRRPRRAQRLLLGADGRPPASGRGPSLSAPRRRASRGASRGGGALRAGTERRRASARSAMRIRMFSTNAPTSGV